MADIAIDKRGANLAGLQSLTVILKLTGVGQMVGIVQSKYPNYMLSRTTASSCESHDP